MRLIKTITLFSGLAVVTIHFLFLAVYGLPVFRNTGIYFPAFAYVNTLFHQNWELFVPPPDVNYRLFVGEQGKPKTEIFGEVVLSHQANRLRGLEPLVIALTNTIHYFEKNSTLQSPLNGPVTGDLYFTMVERLARSYYNNTRHSQVSHPEVYLLVEKAGGGCARVYFN